MLKKLISVFKNFTKLLPSACVLCGDRSGEIANLCEPCKQELPWLTVVCAGCSLPLTNGMLTEQYCGQCLQNPSPFTRVYALCRYEEPVDRLITALKFKHKLVYARLLGELLAERLQDEYQEQPLPTCIIPVPLHAERLRERGFNQAVELARPIVKKLKVPLNVHACQRVRMTQMQTSLPASERQHNVNNAFVVKPNLNIKHVAILDDVITTGHTVTELSKVLEKTGVEQIDVWCCARTVISSAHN